MNLQITNRELPGVICHLGRKSPEKGLQTLTTWAQDCFTRTQSEKFSSQQDVQKALAAASQQLQLQGEPATETTLNGLSAQSFAGARLVGIPAIAGLAGPAVFAIFDDKTAKAFQLNREGNLDELTITNPGNRQMRVEHSNNVVTQLHASKLDYCISNYNNDETFRTTAANRPDQKVTFHQRAGGGEIQVKIANSRLYEASSIDGYNTRFEAAQTDIPGQFTITQR